MAFRNPLRNASTVDPGTAGPRVVVTQTGGRMGGGAVKLYPNTTNDAGELSAGIDDSGAVTVLASPPRPGAGTFSSLILSSTEVGDEGVFLSSLGAIYLDPAPGEVVRGTVLDTCLYDETAGTWRGKYLAAGVFGGDFSWTGYRRPTAYRTPDGMVRLSGLLGLDAAPTLGKLLITGLPPALRPVKAESFACYGGTNRLWRCDVGSDGNVYFQAPMSADWSFTPGSTAGTHALSLSGIAYPSLELF